MLEPLFYDALGTPLTRRRPGMPDVPYLNGGLFERIYGPASLELPDAVFDLESGLLGYLDGWTFTVSEEMPEESEVAVDPEMLGRVFEHLAGEQSVREHGTVYTPRPVVHSCAGRHWCHGSRRRRGCRKPTPAICLPTPIPSPARAGWCRASAPRPSPTSRSGYPPPSTGYG